MKFFKEQKRKAVQAMMDRKLADIDMFIGMVEGLVTLGYSYERAIKEVRAIWVHAGAKTVEQVGGK